MAGLLTGNRLIIAKEKQNTYLDPCEYNPDKKQAAYWDEVHAEAELVVGADGQWRLCKVCAALPFFNRFHTRRRIK